MHRRTMGNIIYLSGRDWRATILLVDSRPLVRLATAAFLRQRQFVVVEATDGEEALKYLRAGRPVHLVFSAVELSGATSDVGLFRTIGREFPQVQVILGGTGNGTGVEYLAELERLVRKRRTEPTCRDPS